MNILTFDKLAYVETLKAGGFDEKQAKAQANALDAALRDSVATSSDLKDVETTLKQEISGVRAEIAETKTELKAEITNVEHEIALVRKDMEAMENRMTVRLGGLIAFATGLLAVLMKIL